MFKQAARSILARPTKARRPLHAILCMQAKSSFMIHNSAIGMPLSNVKLNMKDFTPLIAKTGIYLGGSQASSLLNAMEPRCTAVIG